MSMEDTLVAFINDAKLAADQDSKLYALNQIRELVWHRSPELLDRGLHELAEFQVERAAQIRRFLINLYRDACEKNSKYTAMTVHIFDYFSYDNNDNLIRDLINASIKLFPSIMRMFLQPQDLSLAELWPKWHQLLMRMIGFIDSDKGPQARKAAIRMLEVYAMFALRDEIESVAGQERSGAHAVNITKASPEHPFLRASDIANEAQEAVSRLLLWIQRGGTRTGVFDHGLYAQSIEVVCAIAVRRPSYFTQIAHALTHFIDRKQDVQPQIKETAARASAKLVVAAERTALRQDIEASLAGQKLEVALASQGFGAATASARDAAGPQSRHTVEAQDPRKRKRDITSQQGADVIDPKKSRDDAGVGPAAATATATATTTTTPASTTAARAPAVAAFSKLGEVVMQGNDWQVKPLEVDAHTLRTVGRAALLRFLSGMTTAQQMGFEQLYCSWSTKMAMTMAALETTAETGFSRTTPLRLIPPAKPASECIEMKEGELASNKFLAEKFHLPAALTDAADFCIDTVGRNEMQGEAEGSLSNATQIALDLLTRLFVDVAQSASSGQGDAADEADEADAADAAWDIYDNMLAYTMIKFRNLPSIPAEIAATLICRLPRVPRDAVALLRVSALSDSKRSREWGMRLLRDLTVFCDEISQPCLNALLWFATNPDFELRIKSVHTCHELCEEQTLRDHIMTFSIYVIISVVGTKLLRWRQHVIKDRIAQMAELDSSAPAVEDLTNEQPTQAAGDAAEPVSASEQPMAIENKDEKKEEASAEDGNGDADNAALTVAPYAFSLYNAENLEGYEHSLTVFDGDFLAEGAYDLTGGVELGTEADVKRRIQLICNLTLVQPSMIVALRDASAAVQASIDAMADDQAPDTAPPSDAWSKAKVTDAEAFVMRQQAITQAINSEVQNVAPAIARELGAVRLFTMLRNGDPAGRVLLLAVLRSLTADDHVPPAQDLVRAVLDFVQSNAPTLDSFLVPVVGGLSAAMVEAFLPRLITLGTEATEEMLRRLIRVRPPPISRAAILCALHRIDHEAQNVKLKSVRESIELCLSNRNDFRSEVIREALETMSQDPVPPLMLMRTVILACQAYPELKRVALRTILPRLLERKIWHTSPKLWEGFVVCVKQLATHRDAGDLLRDLLRIPYETLRALVKVATTVEEPLARIVSRMSDQELEDAVAPKAAQEGDAEPSVDAAEAGPREAQEKAIKVRKLLASEGRSKGR